MKFKYSSELVSLLREWKEEIAKETPNVSKSVINKVYKKASQRIVKIASERNDHSASVEALGIAKFLSKTVGIPQVNNTLFELEM